jgi:hypothetical protein
VTDDQHEDLTAIITAHDLLLGFLMANVVQLFPARKRQELLDAVLKMPDLPVPEGMAMSFDGADRLAGITQKTKANMQRIAAEAAKSAGV